MSKIKEKIEEIKKISKETKKKYLKETFGEVVNINIEKFQTYIMSLSVFVSNGFSCNLIQVKEGWMRIQPHPWLNTEKLEKLGFKYHPQKGWLYQFYNPKKKKIILPQKKAA